MSQSHPTRPMRRLWLVPALVVLTAAVWALSASAVDGPQTFSLLEVDIPKNDRPLGDFRFDRPPTGGDEFVVTNALYDKGTRVGRVRVLHTFVTGFGQRFEHRATVLFVAQLYLRGGSMLVQGYGQVSPDGPSKLRLPIVGGTGRYANVRGHLDVRNLSERKTKLDFHVLP
jgi:allene oxide cyclase-like protein